MKKQNGFSLIEVIIAATIFAIGMMALAGMQYTSVYSISAGDKRVAATNLMEQALEAARNQGVSTFDVNSYSGQYDSIGNLVDDSFDSGIKFTRTITVSGNIVQAKVTWNIKGEEKNVTSSTFLY